VRFLSPPPRQALRGSRGVLNFRYLANGRVVVAKAPRSRKLKHMSNTTKQQVVAWDSQLACIKLAPGEDVEFCEALAGKSGFYTRDLLIQAGYGHLISWPGVGVAPAGIVETVVKNGKRRKANILPHGVGNPQLVNTVTSYHLTRTLTKLTITLTTCIDSDPTVWLIPGDYRKIEVPVSRPNRQAPHGQVIFFDHAPVETLTRTGSGDSYTFTRDLSDGLVDAGTWYVVTGQLEDAAHFQWHQPPHKVPPQPRIRFYAYLTVAFTNHVFDPGVIAHFDAVLASTITTVTTNGGEVIASGRQICVDTISAWPFFNGTFQTLYGVQAVWLVRNPPKLPDPSCDLPDPGQQNGLWWLVVAQT
jgi:hypothetical protein